MKLDKIKFAKLIAFIESIENVYDTGVIGTIDDIIDIEPSTSNQFVEVEKVNKLLDCLRDTSTPGGIIPAIKAYRALTNAGLLEAKTAVEQYRKKID